jgi:ubiquinone/menaquinone biosynthesis C-methylase UbiE
MKQKNKIVSAFDKYSNNYDKWFLKNQNVLRSEVALLAYFLKKPGRALSVGCGSGLFEAILKEEYGIIISEGIEPAKGMAEIAIKRGMKVKLGTAEQVDFWENEFDTIIFNGSPSYIEDLETAFKKAYIALKSGGKILVLDVPQESSYALLYNLGKEVGSWEHRYFAGAKPPNVYPIEFVKESNWRSTPEKVDLLTKAGFKNFQYAQTLTKHPVYSDLEFEKPVPGYDRGDYVAIYAEKE